MSDSKNKVRGFQSNPKLDEMLLEIEKEQGYQDRSETLRGIIREKYLSLTKKELPAYEKEH